MQDLRRFLKGAKSFGLPLKLGATIFTLGQYFSMLLRHIFFHVSGYIGNFSWFVLEGVANYFRHVAKGLKPVGENH